MHAGDFDSSSDDDDAAAAEVDPSPLPISW